MPEAERSNYEKMKNSMAAEFLRYDQSAMIRRFSLAHDADWLYIEFAGRRYRVGRTTGAVFWHSERLRADLPAGYNETMTIYDLLCYAKPGCRLSGEWVNVGSLSTIKGGALAKEGNFFAGAGQDFSGRAVRLARACAALGGRKIRPGDVAYELALFPFLPVCVRFWEADEEFPASLQIAVDKNILDFMHYETLMFALTHLLGRLREEAEQAGGPV